MADILLQKPTEGQTTSFTPNADDRIVFEFDPGEALLERDGDNLMLSFEDGSVIELADFYVAYTSENMPEFVIGEAIVPGEAFFAALGEELMPAAGNATGPQGSGSGVGLDDPSLLGGIGREVRLDQERQGTNDDDDNREGGTGGTDGTTGTGGTDGSGGSGSPDIPVNIVPDFNTEPDLASNHLETFDGASRTDGGVLEFTIGDGTVLEQEFSINLDGTEHDLVFGTDGKAIVNTEYGVLTFTRDPNPNDDGSYNLNYSYEQTKAYDHGSTTESDEKVVAESFTVTITDVDGDSATTGDINISITDSGPSIELSFSDDEIVSDASITSGTEVEGSWSSSFGGDGAATDGNKYEISLDGGKTKTAIEFGQPITVPTGTLIINQDGTFSFDSNGNTGGESLSFTMYVKDKDGDTAESSINIDIDDATAPGASVDGSFVELDETGLPQGINPDGTVYDPSKEDSKTDTWSAPDGFTITGVAGDGIDKDLYDVTFDDDGIKVTLKDNVKHDDMGDSNDDASGGKITVTLKDENDNTFTVDVDVKILDDGPVVVENDKTLTMYEKDVAGGTNDLYGQSHMTGNVEFDFGADGMQGGSFEQAFSWNQTTYNGVNVPTDVDGNPILLMTSDDNALISWKESTDPADPTVLIGYGADGKEVIRLDMNENGSYSVTLKQAVEHYAPDAGDVADNNQDIITNPDDLIAQKDNAANVENEWGVTNKDTDTPTDLNFGFTITDGDGDQGEGSVNVNIVDDIITLENSSGDTVDLNAPTTDIDADFNFFDKGADAGSLKDAVGQTTPTESWGTAGGNSWNGNFYGAGSSSITTANGITITGAIVDNNGYMSTTGVNIGWREDNTDRNQDGKKDYQDGIGMTSSTGSDSKWEVGAGGSYEDGAKVEALIITLPDDQLAYGVDLNFGCFFNSGGTASDSQDEYITLEFYKDGKLVHTVKQLVGELGGDGNFDSSTVTVPFDEVRVIPSENGSDFVLNGVDFADYGNTIIATGEGTIEVGGADGLAGAIGFESIGIEGGAKVDVKEGSEITLEDGTKLTLQELGTNVFVAVANAGTTSEEAYFTLSLDGDGNWTMHQHAEFSDDITITFGGKDNDGDHTTVDVTVEGMEFGNLTVDQLATQDADVDKNGKDSDFGELTFTATEGVKDITITINGEKHTINLNDKNVTIPGADGDLLIAGITQNGDEYTMEYSYTQDENHAHERPSDDITTDEVRPNAESFDITITDNNGQSESATIGVTITDDEPSVGADVNTATNGDSAVTIVGLDFGGDDGAGKTIEFDGVTFTYGDTGWAAGAGGNVVNDNGVITLEVGDTSLKNSGNSDLWTVSNDNLAPNTTTTTDIKITDSDGDSKEVSVNVEQTSTELPKEEIVGIDGTETHFTDGVDYNVCIVLDTSGSMYVDRHGDIVGDETRLDAACDAIIDFVKNDLYPHTQNEITGGEVNLQVVTFWGKLDVVIDGTQSLDQAIDKVYAEINALRELTKNESDPNFHWGTNYELGLNTAAKWFESDAIKDNGHENVVFFMSDGVPHQGNTANGVENLHEALEAAGGGVIHAVGMGEGADPEHLDAIDSTGKATIVKDKDISTIFTPENGTSVTTEHTSIGSTGSGDDVLIGGINATDLKAYLSKSLDAGVTLTDKMVVDFIRNHPEWLNENAANLANDPDVLIAGTGDDLVYGQGGNDVLIGDANADALSGFAKDLGMQSKDGVYDINDPNAKDSDTELFAEDLAVAAQNATIGDLIAAADKLENINVDAEGNVVADGNDTIYGGDGAEGTANDVILGLGGDDSLFGGEGDDIILGGSGNDYLEGGEGDDILIGGEGEDKLFGGAGDDTISIDIDDVLVDGGEGMDVLLAGTSDPNGVKDMIVDGKIENVEMIVMGDDASKATDSIKNGIFDTIGWNSTGNEVSQEGTADNTFIEYESEDGSMTILVNQTLLTNNNL